MLPCGESVLRLANCNFSGANSQRSPEVSCAHAFFTFEPQGSRAGPRSPATGNSCLLGTLTSHVLWQERKTADKDVDAAGRRRPNYQTDGVSPLAAAAFAHAVRAFKPDETPLKPPFAGTLSPDNSGDEHDSDQRERGERRQELHGRPQRLRLKAVFRKAMLANQATPASRRGKSDGSTQTGLANALAPSVELLQLQAQLEETAALPSAGEPEAVRREACEAYTAMSDQAAWIMQDMLKKVKWTTSSITVRKRGLQFQLQQIQPDPCLPLEPGQLLPPDLESRASAIKARRLAPSGLDDGTDDAQDRKPLRPRPLVQVAQVYAPLFAYVYTDIQIAALRRPCAAACRSACRRAA